MVNHTRYSCWILYRSKERENPIKCGEAESCEKKIRMAALLFCRIYRIARITVKKSLKIMLRVYIWIFIILIRHGWFKFVFCLLFN